MKRLLLVLTVVSLLCGCTTRLGAFTMLSTQNVEPSRFHEYQRQGRVEGKHTQHFILGQAISSSPNLQDAVDNAILQKPGGVTLINAVIRTFEWSILLYGQLGYIVEGEILVDPKLTSNTPPSN